MQNVQEKILDLLDKAKSLASRTINDVSKLTSHKYVKLNDKETKILYYSALTTVLLGGTIYIIFRKKATKKDDPEEDFLMKGIVATGYKGLESLKISRKLIKPSKLAANEVLIRVKAVSIDPVDIRILQGHGKSVTSYLTKNQKCLDANVVLIPGRDCSGIIVKVGDDVQGFDPGDEVWAYSPPWKGGLMTELVTVTEEQVAFKPKNLNFESSASLPYAGLITWNALVNQAGLNPETARNKRVLIHLGSYAIGALAIQMVKLWGGHVTTTVPTIGLPLVRFLGADDVIVYSVTNFQEELLRRKKFDVIFNTVGSILHELSMSLCNKEGFVVSAMAPFPSHQENQGLICRLFRNAWFRTKSELSEVFTDGLSMQKWEMFSFDQAILNNMKDLVENGKIQPIVEDVFNFEDAIKAFERVASGDTVGRTVIKL